jgi:hypothetical protein
MTTPVRTMMIRTVTVPETLVQIEPEWARLSLFHL